MHEKTSVPALIEEIYTFLRQADAKELNDLFRALTECVVIVRVADGSTWVHRVWIVNGQIRDVVIPVTCLVTILGYEVNSLVDILQLVGPWSVHVSHLHVQIVGYLGAYRTVDEDIQVEVLVAEGVVPSEGPLREWRTDVGLIILVNLTIFVDVLVLQVAYIGGVGAVEQRWVVNPCIVLGAICICCYRDRVVRPAGSVLEN